MEEHRTPNEATPPPRPRWVKVSAIVVGIVLAALVVLALAGDHGPSRHGPGGGNGEGHTPPVEHAP